MAEFGLYKKCENRAEEFAKHAPFWREIANPDGTVNSAYGWLIWKNHSCGNFGKGMYDGVHTPWEWAVESLRRDKNTRQAFLRFSLPDHQWFGNKDQVCTMHGQFLIRNDKLHFTIVMRSNDIVRGFVYDVPWFCSLMEKMVEELMPVYPDLTIGQYVHMVHSLHMYESDFPLVCQMLGENNDNGKPTISP